MSGNEQYKAHVEKPLGTGASHKHCGPVLLCLTKEIEMFVSIETNGASHIVIHVPHEGSEKSLPAIARMLEQNTTFIRSDYSSIALVKPSMNISLSGVFTHERQEEVFAIKESSAVIGDDFVNATPDVLVSNSKGMKREKDENSRLRTELSFVKQQLAAAKEQLDAIVDAEPL